MKPRTIHKALPCALVSTLFLWSCGESNVYFAPTAGTKEASQHENRQNFGLVERADNIASPNYVQLDIAPYILAESEGPASLWLDPSIMKRTYVLPGDILFASSSPKQSGGSAFLRRVVTIERSNAFGPWRVATEPVDLTEAVYKGVVSGPQDVPLSLDFEEKQEGDLLTRIQGLEFEWIEETFAEVRALFWEERSRSFSSKVKLDVNLKPSLHSVKVGKLHKARALVEASGLFHPPQSDATFSFIRADHVREVRACHAVVADILVVLGQEPRCLLSWRRAIFEQENGQHEVDQMPFEISTEQSPDGSWTCSGGQASHPLRMPSLKEYIAFGQAPSCHSRVDGFEITFHPVGGAIEGALGVELELSKNLVVHERIDSGFKLEYTLGRTVIVMAGPVPIPVYVGARAGFLSLDTTEVDELDWLGAGLGASVGVELPASLRLYTPTLTLRRHKDEPLQLKYDTPTLDFEIGEVDGYISLEAKLLELELLNVGPVLRVFGQEIHASAGLYGKLSGKASASIEDGLNAEACVELGVKAKLATDVTFSALGALEEAINVSWDTCSGGALFQGLCFERCKASQDNAQAPPPPMSRHKDETFVLDSSMGMSLQVAWPNRPYRDVDVELFDAHGTSLCGYKSCPSDDFKRYAGGRQDCLTSSAPKCSETLTIRPTAPTGLYRFVLNVSDKGALPLGMRVFGASAGATRELDVVYDEARVTAYVDVELEPQGSSQVNGKGNKTTTYYGKVLPFGKQMYSFEKEAFKTYKVSLFSPPDRDLDLYGDWREANARHATVASAHRHSASYIPGVVEQFVFTASNDGRYWILVDGYQNGGPYTLQIERIE